MNNISYKDLLKLWFKHKLKLEDKSITSDRGCLKEFYPRQVYWANLGTNIGNEIRKVRPVLVLSDLKYNHGNTIVVAPLSTTDHKYSLYYNLYKSNYRNTGLERDSVVKVDQIRTISISRICKNGLGETDDLKNISPMFYVNDKDWLGISARVKRAFGSLLKS